MARRLCWSLLLATLVLALQPGLSTRVDPRTGAVGSALQLRPVYVPAPRTEAPRNLNPGRYQVTELFDEGDNEYTPRPLPRVYFDPRLLQTLTQRQPEATQAPPPPPAQASDALLRQGPQQFLPQPGDIELMNQRRLYVQRQQQLIQNQRFESQRLQNQLLENQRLENQRLENQQRQDEEAYRQQQQQQVQQQQQQPQPKPPQHNVNNVVNQSLPQQQQQQQQQQYIDNREQALQNQQYLENQRQLYNQQRRDGLLNYQRGYAKKVPKFNYWPVYYKY